MAYRDAEFAGVPGIRRGARTATTSATWSRWAPEDAVRRSRLTPGNGRTRARQAVKANIGHTMSASGIAGLIRRSCAPLPDAPPQAGCSDENPNSSWPPRPFFLPRTAMPLGVQRTPRRGWSQLLRIRRHPMRTSCGGGCRTRHAAPQRAPAPAESSARSLFLLAGARASLVAKSPGSWRPDPRCVAKSHVADVAYTSPACPMPRPGSGGGGLVRGARREADRLRGGPGEARPTARPTRWLPRCSPPSALPGGGIRAGNRSNQKICLLFSRPGCAEGRPAARGYEQLPAFRERLIWLDDLIADLHGRSRIAAQLPLRGDPPPKQNGGSPPPSLASRRWRRWASALQALWRSSGCAGTWRSSQPGRVRAAGAAGFLTPRTPSAGRAGGVCRWSTSTRRSAAMASAAASADVSERPWARSRAWWSRI